MNEELEKFLQIHSIYLQSIIENLKNNVYKIFGKYPEKDPILLTDNDKIKEIIEKRNINEDLLSNNIVLVADNEEVYIIITEKHLYTYYKEYSKKEKVSRLFLQDMTYLYSGYVVEKYFSKVNNKNVDKSLFGYDINYKSLILELISSLSHTITYKNNLDIIVEEIIRKSGDLLFSDIKLDDILYQIRKLKDNLYKIIYNNIYVDQMIREELSKEYMKIQNNFVELYENIVIYRSNLFGSLLAKYFYQKYGDRSLEILLKRLKEYEEMDKIFDKDIIDKVKDIYKKIFDIFEESIKEKINKIADELKNLKIFV